MVTPGEVLRGGAGRGLLPALGALVLFLTLGRPPAEASMAALQGRGLPPDLALDPSGLRDWPGAAAVLEGGLVVDRDRALALTSGGTRAGWLLQGETQNLVLAGAGRWGLALGYRDLVSRDRQTASDGTRLMEEYSRFYRVRELRLAAGLHLESASGRTVEMTVAGGPGRYEGRSRYLADLITGSGVEPWRLGPGTGYVLGAGIRTLAPATGLLAAVRLSYRDAGADPQPAPPWSMVERGIEAAAAWRFLSGDGQDLVAGLEASWAQDRIPGFSPAGNQFTREYRAEEELTARLFLSGERRAAGTLTVRAGVSGGIGDRRTRTSEEWTGRYRVDRVRRSRTLGDPAIAVGAGWVWRGLRLDAVLDADFQPSRPFARWSLTLPL